MGVVIPLNQEPQTFEEFLGRHPDIQEANVALRELAKVAFEAGRKAGCDQGYSAGFDHGYSLGIVGPPSGA